MTNTTETAHAIEHAEHQRLGEELRREKNWKRWGPYLAERQWGTVREDYSADGDCWNYLPHDHARSRAYRWGEDGLLGICDRECRLCFALALWNGRDPILKERLFGLANPEGNHGEDVKEQYFYLDSTPTHTHMKAMYRYPQAEYPYQKLVDENRSRGQHQSEYELIDTGVFEDGKYFDVTAEYVKIAADDILILITIANRAAETATLHVLPTLWFRNTWSWGTIADSPVWKPRLKAIGETMIEANHPTLGAFELVMDSASDGSRPNALFTENESNNELLFHSTNSSRFVKDAFHRYVVDGEAEAVNPQREGTKAAAHYQIDVPAQGEVTIRFRLRAKGAEDASALTDWDTTFKQRRQEADAFYAATIPANLGDEERHVARQAYAGLLWSKQFYHYVVEEWLNGDPDQPPPPEARKRGRNTDWGHLFNRDVISMPDKWEYPWYAAWDLAFHMIPFARIDPHFAKDQLLLMLREWYMHPNGQIPAYEFAFSDVNPPVHAWACWRVYKMTGPRGGRDRQFLARTFQKLLINFTWWVNRKDPEGKHLFSGGFLGLDNIGVFDRSRPLPFKNGSGHLEQADGTAWMAFYCGTMLAIALELASEDATYEGVASKFFEHFVAIADAINTLDGSGLWDENDGFYYDKMHIDHTSIPLKVRSLVGLIPLLAVEVIEHDVLEKLPGFTKRMSWFLENRQDLARHISYMNVQGGEHAKHTHYLLAIPSRDRLQRVLRYMLDETEFLSPFGIRSVSRIHETHPYVFSADGQEFRVDYTPGESTTGLFGGNSNWRGPIWFPVNYLLIEALERYHHFYGSTFTIESPTGTGSMLNLGQVASMLRRRLTQLFLPNERGERPCHGGDRLFATDPHWRQLILFHEYFHADTGRGLGANHQTGWTALVAQCLENLATRDQGAAPR